MASHSRRVSGIFNKRLLHIAIICLLGLIVYSNTFHAPFQWDEGPFIRDNPVVKDFSYFLHPSDAPANFYGALVGRYIGFLTFAINYRIGGFNVTGYHIFNLTVHILNAILVYLLVVLTFRTPYFRWHSAKGIGHGATDKDQATPHSAEGIGQQACKLASSQAVKPASLQAGSESSNLQPQDSRFKIQDSRYFIALFAALLFVSHPLQIEAVTYIFQRLASLAAMFYLLSIVFYIKARLGYQSSQADRQQAASKDKQAASKSSASDLEPRTSNAEFSTSDLKPQTSDLEPFASNLKPQTRSRWPVVWLILSFLSAVLAMKTKENAFTLPIIIILYEFLFFEGTKKTRALFLAPISLTLLIIPVTLLLTSGTAPNPYNPSTIAYKHIPRWDYLVTQSRVLVTYLRLFFLPFNQDIDYDYPVFHSALNPEVFLSAFFLLLLFGFAVYLLYKSKGHGAKSIAHRAKGEEQQAGKLASLQPPTSNLQPVSFYYRLIGFGILWFFITLSVESSLQPIPQIMDEYRMYLPMAGAALCLATGLLLLAQRFGTRKVGRAVTLLAFFSVAAFSVTAYQRNSVWETNVSLWKDAATKSPRKVSVHTNLGSAYARENEFDKAINQYELAMRLDPYYREPYYDLCLAYSKQDRPDRAINYCRTAAVLYPGDVQTHYNLGLMCLQKGLINEARSQIEIVLQLNPDSYKARELLDEMNNTDTGQH